MVSIGSWGLLEERVITQLKVGTGCGGVGGGGAGSPGVRVEGGGEGGRSGWENEC